MEATGTGKSRLSVDLATHFRGEIINSDKMQVYKGLDIMTNKITHAEKQGVQHYLLGEIELDSDFTAEHFCLNFIVYQEKNLNTQCVPIIIGGSNLYIEKLVEERVFMFKYKYGNCFIWIDVEQLILNRRVDTKVYEMINAGEIEPYSDFTAEDFCLKSIVYIEIFEDSIAISLERRVDTRVDEMVNAGEIEPDSHFTAEDFYLKSIVYIEIFLKTQCVPIIVGGSNLYIEKLVEDPVFMFKYKYDNCFIWIDVEQSVLNRRVDTRVDEMVNATKMNTFINNNNKFNKKKVVFVMGSIGTGKSHFSVELATHFQGETINLDKMQVYKGLDRVTNNITHAQKQDVQHYLLEQSVDTRVNEIVNAGLVNEARQIFIPDADYTKGIRLSTGLPEMVTYLREEKI
ncbi:hypothetical protein H5410_001642 [Solanum commersonii]|uniref:Isopentenyltransferase n=1 Tax=Solanum commersonii TaxID=4109 RepID=A0A9J6AZC2_SOLCO|nr:hypothetical protein H5410_001642 [Solanum commersonii]